MAHSKVGFIGLGAMGYGMATTLVRKGYSVQGYDISEPAVQRFADLGGVRSNSPAEAAKDTTVLILMVATSDQVEDVLFGAGGSLSVLSPAAVIIICSTVAPSYVQTLEKRLLEKGFGLVDAPVSGGVARAAAGTLTIMASGDSKTLEGVKPLLSAMSEKLYLLGGGVGTGSKVKMVNQLLAGVHIAASAEAMALGARAGINTRLLYDIISNAAGSSWMFVNRVPHMLDGDYFPHSALNIFVKDLGIVLKEAKSLYFPSPLAAVAHQEFILGSSLGYGREDDAAVVKIWEKTVGVNVTSPKLKAGEEEMVEDICKNPKQVSQIAFIGLGAMGFGMATHLVKSQTLSVSGFDVYEPSMRRFQQAGGKIGTSPQEVAKGAEVLVIMVTNEDQVESVLFGDRGAISALGTGSAVIICSTVSPNYVRELGKRLADRQLHLVDAPVSGGVAKAATGSLTIMAAGTSEALKQAGLVLSEMSEKLYIIGGGAGAGSSVKMVNQLLAGIHIAVAAEAMALGAHANLDTEQLFTIISNAAGSSWMFLNRVPHMLAGDYTPHSALNIFVKDLGIVLNEANRLKISLPLASAAHQQFLLGSSAGFGREDDAAVVKIYEKLAGVNVAVRKNPKLSMDDSSAVKASDTVSAVSRQSLLSSLPDEWAEDVIDELKDSNNHGSRKVLVVLDDDPTGTQTVHGVDVLTEWSIPSLEEELKAQPSCFFILTNSRALSGNKAALLVEEICSNMNEASVLAGNVPYTIVLRGDSTLRGHFPEEADAAAKVIGELDGWIICPFFWQGGRYTINDIHYVADGEMLIPAGQTEFAKDHSFGFKSSNLREWVEEKTNGRIQAKDVTTVSIDMIRKGGPSAVCDHLSKLTLGKVCIVNSASEKDIEVFAAGMIQAESKGKKFLCRTAAGFVSARLGLRPRPPITPVEFGAQRQASWHNGGLTVVGSYVPKTTKQVQDLLTDYGHMLECLTVDVASLALSSETIREKEISRVSRMANTLLSAGKDTLIMTSRDLLLGKSPTESLEIGNKVSSALVEIVKRIHTRPRYILAKGGITSSDLATKAMGTRRAEVIGQVLPGVPLWKLGPGSLHAGIPYIVFPGNVGGSDAVTQVVKSWSKPPRLTMKEILLAADVGGYAVGAFNVYNLEGALSVIAAAEAERSPVILQIHPAALVYGGKSLIDCCISAAKHAMVPVAVHLDHGSEERTVLEALDMGFDSVMVDGSNLSYEANVVFTRKITDLAKLKSIAVEAELGRLSGTEDGLTIDEYQSKLTDVKQTKDFLERTKVDALAVCIGNVHGKYPASGAKLDFNLLKDLKVVASEYNVPLVLHGASGLPCEMVKACIEIGVRKFNVNTEVRTAYMQSIARPKKDLIEVLASAKEAMQTVVVEKLRMFGSSGRAP